MMDVAADDGGRLVLANLSGELVVATIDELAIAGGQRSPGRQVRDDDEALAAPRSLCRSLKQNRASDKKGLVGLCNSARSVEAEIGQPIAELLEGHRHSRVIPLPATHFTDDNRARMAHTALERWTRRSFSCSMFVSLP